MLCNRFNRVIFQNGQSSVFSLAIKMFVYITFQDIFCYMGFQQSIFFEIVCIRNGSKTSCQSSFDQILSFFTKHPIFGTDPCYFQNFGTFSDEMWVSSTALGGRIVESFKNCIASLKSVIVFQVLFNPIKVLGGQVEWIPPVFLFLKFLNNGWSY